MHKCLFVSDLDGTLLRSDETLSEYTCNTINRLTKEGMIFSYATARSLITAKKVTRGLNVPIPLIVYNGAFIVDNVTEEIIAANYFEEEMNGVFEELLMADIWPVVYSYIDKTEYFSFIPEKCNAGMEAFLKTRKGDKRWREAPSFKELTAGNTFYILCIDTKDKLKPFYEKYKDKYHAVFQQDIYTKEQWLEIMPKNASKANAVLQLKTRLGCNKVVAFGDALNDMDMFKISDEAYAVENAMEEVKAAADGVIGSNDEDGVAGWLEHALMFRER